MNTPVYTKSDVSGIIKVLIEDLCENPNRLFQLNEFFRTQEINFQRLALIFDFGEFADQTADTAKRDILCISPTRFMQADFAHRAEDV